MRIFLFAFCLVLPSCSGASELEAVTTGYSTCGVGLVGSNDLEGFTHAERFFLDAWDVYAAHDAGVESWQLCHDLYDWHIIQLDAGEFQGTCQSSDGGFVSCSVVGEAQLSLGYARIANLGSWSKSAYAHEMCHIAQWLHGRQIDYTHSGWQQLGIWNAINAADAEMADAGM